MGRQPPGTISQKQPPPRPPGEDEGEEKNGSNSNIRNGPEQSRFYEIAVLFMASAVGRGGDYVSKGCESYCSKASPISPSKLGMRNSSRVEQIELSCSPAEIWCDSIKAFNFLPCFSPLSFKINGNVSFYSLIWACF